MKTSWIIFIVMAYLGILYFAGIMELSNLIDTQVKEDMMALGQPTGTDFNLISLVVQVWAYLKVIIPMMFLWNPTIWSGYWIWFYWIVCFPIVIGMVVSIVMVMRGVGTS